MLEPERERERQGEKEQMASNTKVQSPPTTLAPASATLTSPAADRNKSFILEEIKAVMEDWTTDGNKPPRKILEIASGWYRLFSRTFHLIIYSKSYLYGNSFIVFKIKLIMTLTLGCQPF